MTHETEARDLTSADLDQAVGGGAPSVSEVVVTKHLDCTSSGGFSGGTVSVSSFNFMKKTD